MASEQYLYGIWHVDADDPRLGSWTSVNGRIIADTYAAVRDLGLPGQVRTLPPTITAAEFTRAVPAPHPSPKEQ